MMTPPAPRKRFSDERRLATSARNVEHRRVKLYELDVRELCSCARRQREPVARHIGGIGRRREGLTVSSRREHDGACLDTAHVERPANADAPDREARHVTLVVE